ncbi:MAG: hypothetical protein IJR99_16180 [Kiritimatiellae bacterium]|nr:hypothetical protein [Kiritimatiellia bacterium]
MLSVAAAHGITDDDKISEYLLEAFKVVSNDYFDYQGLAGSPTKRYSFTDAERLEGWDNREGIPGLAGEKQGNDFDEPSYCTLKGIVVARAKINNLLWAIFGRSLGYSTWALQQGALYNAILRGHDEDSTSQNAIVLGGRIFDRLFQNPNDLDSLLTRDNVLGMQTADNPSGLNDVNLWPQFIREGGFTMPAQQLNVTFDETTNGVPRTGNDN